MQSGNEKQKIKHYQSEPVILTIKRAKEQSRISWQRRLSKRKIKMIRKEEREDQMRSDVSIINE